MAHQLTNPSPEVYGNLDLWIAYNRNPARCAFKRLILRIEAGIEVPPSPSIELDGESFSADPDDNIFDCLCSGSWSELKDLEITFQQTENKRLTKLPTLGPQFSIEFSIKVSSYPSSGMANIFHFTSTGGECCQLGDRVPAIFLDSRGRLRVAFPLYGDGDELLKIRKTLRKKKWYKVKIIQDKV